MWALPEGTLKRDANTM